MSARSWPGCQGVGRAHRARLGLPRGPLRLLVVVLLCLLVWGCNKPYRIGEYVMVEWEGREYPAYIIAKKGRSRYRVHYEGFNSRWDEDVTLDRIKGRVRGAVKPPPPPPKVARASGLKPVPSGSSGKALRVAPYKVGDRLRVRWRGSVYTARVLVVEAPDRFLVHYEGHESAWDESIELERIVGRR